MSVKNGLIAAKALIENPENWTRNPTWTKPACAFAAVGLACHGAKLGDHTHGVTHYEITAQQQLARYIPADFDGDRSDVIAYNDDPATTHADIMALFDRAIEAAE